MRTFDLIMYVLAAFCFLLATLGVSHSRVSFLALGLFFWVLVPLNVLAHTSS